jgi:hypothetical protein
LLSLKVESGGRSKGGFLSFGGRIRLSGVGERVGRWFYDVGVLAGLVAGLVAVGFLVAASWEVLSAFLPNFVKGATPTPDNSIGASPFVKRDITETLSGDDSPLKFLVRRSSPPLKYFLMLPLRSLASQCPHHTSFPSSSPS